MNWNLLFTANKRPTRGEQLLMSSVPRLALLTMLALIQVLQSGIIAFASDPSVSQLQATSGGDKISTVTNLNAATLSAFSMESLDDKQKLGVGDRISFRVVEDQEEPKSLTVTDAGQLNVPELGLVHAAGKSCKELAFELKSKLEQTTYYKATVILGIDLLNKTSSGRKVYVAGQVRQAGPQEIPAGETWTVSKAILKAGGFTDFADKKHVRVVRGGVDGKGGQSFYVNISEVWEKGQVNRDLPVEPEDLIYVPARGINFY